jgi:SNF2 family DNA or RNA helicase
MGYVTVKTKHLYNLTIPDYSHANNDMINDKINHLFLSFTQEQAGFDQVVNEHIHIVEMQDKTYKAAKKLRQDKILIKQDGNAIEADTPVKLMNKLHQIYSGSVINDTDGSYTIFDENKASFIFDTWTYNKKAIFYKFKAEREIIIKNAILRGYNYTESPEEFNNSDNNTIFISQIQSGREGINLSSADILIMYNIDFSAVSYWQARSRMQTKNRDRPAEVHWIFAKDGIEQRIYNAVSNKKNYTLSYFKKHEKL